MKQQFKRLKWACYTVNLSMSVVCNLPPVLFLTFRSLYGLSYSQLGLLILINYLTQLSVDMVFSLFSHKFDIPKIVKTTPVLTFLGMLIYGGWHLLFPYMVYFGLVLGTVIYSASAGLCEVLISPVIAAIPSDDPDREMSTLHSVYAWGVVPVVVLSSLYLVVFGSHLWYILVFLFLLVPFSSILLFFGTQIPPMRTPEKLSGTLQLFRNKTLWLCVLAIFLGGAAECNMAQWASGYVEQALGLPKIWGDMFGVALFAVMLGMGRTLYSKIGKNIFRVFIFGSAGAAVCYWIACVSTVPVVGMLACAFTGFCVSMLWPGNLLVSADKFPKSGVFIYAMMAAGGDLGASVVPQFMGVITDISIKHPKLILMADKLSLYPEQFGMRVGMLFSSLFPLISIFVGIALWKSGRKSNPICEEGSCGSDAE